MRCLWFGLLLAACGDDGGTTPSAPDAATSIDAPASSGCDGACRTTALTAMFASTRTLDLAYYGVVAASGKLRVEAYGEVTPGCPSMSSPQPSYTLVMTDIAPPPMTGTANMLDFSQNGELLGGPLGSKATSVTFSNSILVANDFVAFDVQATFSDGTVTGHLFAAHCASLDE